MKFPGGESWSDVKYRGLKFISELNGRTTLAVTHGGFIFSMLASKGFGKMFPHGAIIGLDYEPYRGNLLAEYQQIYGKTTAEQIEEFNPKFDEVFDKMLKVEFTYEVPDLEEN